MNFHRAKATSTTSPCHPRNRAPMRMCLSSRWHLLRSQHRHWLVFSKSCSLPRSAQRWPPLWEEFLLSPLHRWCQWQVSAPALFPCKNVCPQLQAVGWGVPQGKCDPLRHTCHFKRCSLPVLPSLSIFFPSNLA